MYITKNQFINLHTSVRNGVRKRQELSGTKQRGANPFLTLPDAFLSFVRNEIQCQRGLSGLAGMSGMNWWVAARNLFFFNFFKINQNHG
jgi:hypothetical protein